MDYRISNNGTVGWNLSQILLRMRQLPDRNGQRKCPATGRPRGRQRSATAAAMVARVRELAANKRDEGWRSRQLRRPRFQVGAFRPGEFNHSLMRAAVSACRAL